VVPLVAAAVPALAVAVAAGFGLLALTTRRLTVPDCPVVVGAAADDVEGAAAAELSAVWVGLAARGFVPAERACKVSKVRALLVYSNCVVGGIFEAIQIWEWPLVQTVEVLRRAASRALSCLLLQQLTLPEGDLTPCCLEAARLSTSESSACVLRFFLFLLLRSRRASSRRDSEMPAALINASRLFGDMVLRVHDTTAQPIKSLSRDAYNTETKQASLNGRQFGASRGEQASEAGSVQSSAKRHRCCIERPTRTVQQMVNASRNPTVVIRSQQPHLHAPGASVVNCVLCLRLVLKQAC
jgi:hypothetical protein